MAVLFLIMIQSKTHTETEILLKKENLLHIRKSYQLSKLLMTKESVLQYHINKPLYRVFQIPKKSGKFRIIEAPNEDLLSIQQRLNNYLQALYETVRPTGVHGFIRSVYGKESKGIVSNANVHVGKKHVLNLDLMDFFPSINAKRVKEVLLEEPYKLNDEPVVLITLLCTYNKHLPTGAPTSPVLANMVCYTMDQELEAYCMKNDLSYTRYADDLTFSSFLKITDQVIEGIKSIISLNGFQVNPKKQRLLSNRGQQKVTGLIVNEKVNVDRKYIRRIRAMIYSMQNMGYELAAAKHYQLTKIDPMYTAKFIYKLKGQIEYVGQVRGKNDNIYKKFLDQFRSSLDLNNECEFPF